MEEKNKEERFNIQKEDFAKLLSVELGKLEERAEERFARWSKAAQTSTQTVAVQVGPSFSSSISSTSTDSFKTASMVGIYLWSHH